MLRKVAAATGAGTRVRQRNTWRGARWRLPMGGLRGQAPLVWPVTKYRTTPRHPPRGDEAFESAGDDQDRSRWTICPQVERASWAGKEGRKSQSSLAVYEIEAGRVANVWYYPAEKD